MRLETHYGKAEVSTYRTYGTPLEGVRRIPESAFDGRPNIILAASIDVQVLGDAFTAAYTEGDNSNVVATDTMPREDWVKTRTFCWMTAFLHFDKVLQIPLIIVHEICGVSYRELIEAFLDERAETYPILIGAFVSAHDAQFP